jgi:hypothetical protein
MELKDENEKKILEEIKSETSDFTEYTLKEEREKTEDSDNDNSGVQSEKEQQNLRNLSTSSTKATNWSMQMLGEHNILKSMKEYLLAHPDLIAIRGNMDNIITNSQSQKMCIMLKFKRPITKTTIYKLVHECPSLPSNVNVTIDAVTKAELVKEGLDKISQNTEDREPFEKGDFKYSRFGKDKKVDPSKDKKGDASNKIRELGLHKAKLWWADNHLPFTEFIKAEKQYNWEIKVKNSQYAEEEDTEIDPMSKIQELGLSNAKLWWAERNLPYKAFVDAEKQYEWKQTVIRQAELAKKSAQEKKIDPEAEAQDNQENRKSQYAEEKDTKIDPMSKIQELGLSNAKLWWAERNLPYKAFVSAETQYNWVQTVMRQAELAKKSDQEEKIDPMSKIIELGLTEAKLLWATKHLPYKEFKTAEVQYNWEQDAIREAKKLSEKSNEIDPMRKIEEMGVSKARAWWARHHLPHKEFEKLKLNITGKKTKRGEKN